MLENLSEIDRETELRVNLHYVLTLVDGHVMPSLHWGDSYVEPAHQTKNHALTV